MTKLFVTMVRKLLHLEQPFHLTYLGAGANYYWEHHVLTLALPCAALFVIFALDLIAELVDKE